MERLVSYAQNREDMILHTLLHATKKGFYVDVGANHEDLHSVTKFFYLRGWRGINIEPTKRLFDEINEKRKRDINLNLAISNKTGTIAFREYPHHDGLSTMDTTIMSNHEAEKLPHIDYKVKAVPLKQIFKQHKVTVIDFLKIDVEGYELECIESNDWKKYRPRIVVVEATHRQKLIDIFEGLDYRYEFFDGLNLYFVEKDNTESTINDYCTVLLSYGYDTIDSTRLREEYEKSVAIAAAEKQILTDQLERVEKMIRPLRAVLHQARKLKGNR